MNTYSKATADISHITIIIHAAQQSEAINNQHISLGSLFRSSLSITYHLLILQQGQNQFQMFLSNHMRCNQQAPILMLIEEADEDFLIWRP